MVDSQKRKTGGVPSSIVRNIKAGTLPFHFSVVSFCGVILLEFSRRDSASHDADIQVGTPKRGSTQRIKTMYATKNPTNQSQSGINFSPLDQ
jgi:hypothetical protein